MYKLNIEAVTGQQPEEFGLPANSDFLTDNSGMVIGLTTTAGGFDYGASDVTPELSEIIDTINEEKGEAN